MLIWMSQGEDGLNSSRGRVQEPQSERTGLANDSGVRFRNFLWHSFNSGRGLIKENAKANYENVRKFFLGIV